MPGVPLRRGPFSEAEQNLFIARSREWSKREELGKSWGIFSLVFPFRVGYHCQQFFEKIKAGKVAGVTLQTLQPSNPTQPQPHPLIQQSPKKSESELTSSLLQLKNNGKVCKVNEKENGNSNQKDKLMEREEEVKKEFDLPIVKDLIEKIEKWVKEMPNPERKSRKKQKSDSNEITTKHDKLLQPHQPQPYQSQPYQSLESNNQMAKMNGLNGTIGLEGRERGRRGRKKKVDPRLTEKKKTKTESIFNAKNHYGSLKKRKRKENLEKLKIVRIFVYGNELNFVSATSKTISILDHNYKTTNVNSPLPIFQISPFQEQQEEKNLQNFWRVCMENSEMNEQTLNSLFPLSLRPLKALMITSPTHSSQLSSWKGIFEKINAPTIQSIVGEGILFVWVEKEHISWLVRFIEGTWKFEYIENLVWVKKSVNNSIFTDNSSQSNISKSKLSLLFFRNKTLSSKLELRHQRSPDVIFDFDKHCGYIPEKAFQTIETLLPLSEEEKKSRKFMLLSCGDNKARENWTFVNMQKLCDSK